MAHGGRLARARGGAWRAGRGLARAGAAGGPPPPPGAEVAPGAGGGGAAREGEVGEGGGPARLDSFVAGALAPELSRGAVQRGIREGRAEVNGHVRRKPAGSVRPGDHVRFAPPAPQATEALPEALPLDVRYEDRHLVVVDKAAGMAVHPAPGTPGGTLVNAVLHHCRLPAMRFLSGSSPSADGGGWGHEGEGGLPLGSSVLQGPEPVVRPGIVHRLDKGTSGLLVVAKDEATHRGLCAQFQARSVERTYVSVVSGVPEPAAGDVVSLIGRDPRDRKRMAVVDHARRGRHAASGYRMLEALPGAALVEWKLRTGRTHQIRVHARHLGHPILGDAAYGGTNGETQARLSGGGERAGAGAGAARAAAVRKALEALGRPALHARDLGFEHPVTGERLRFTSEPPQDMWDLRNFILTLGDGAPLGE